MKMAIIGMVIAFCLSGCATATKTYTSDGKLGYSITCPVVH